MISNIRKDKIFEKPELNKQSHSVIIVSKNLDNKNESIEYINSECLFNIDNEKKNKIESIDDSIEKNNSILISPIYII